jgi:hypothetical protein
MRAGDDAPPANRHELVLRRQAGPNPAKQRLVHRNGHDHAPEDAIAGDDPDRAPRSERRNSPDGERPSRHDDVSPALQRRCRRRAVTAAQRLLEIGARSDLGGRPARLLQPRCVCVQRSS